jgi:hypothetical protein
MVKIQKNFAEWRIKDESWNLEEGIPIYTFYCTNCGKTPSGKISRYCPNCGMMMDKYDDEEE